MVPILLSSFAFCFSAIELNIEGSMSYVKSNAALSNQNCSPRSSISCFLSWVLPQSLPHCMALIWKLSPPSSHLLFIPLVWYPSVVVAQSLSCVRLCDPHELQHVRLPCPSLSSQVCSNSCPLSQ